MYGSDFDILYTRHVTSTTMTETELTITFDNGTQIIYDAEGDCCSHSYIEDIDDIDVLQNCTILSVDCVEGKTSWDEDESTKRQWTFYKFKTNKGYATLSFRNDSNGYYSGWLSKRK